MAVQLLLLVCNIHVKQKQIRQSMRVMSSVEFRVGVWNDTRRQQGWCVVQSGIQMTNTHGEWQLTETDKDLMKWSSVCLWLERESILLVRGAIIVDNL